jgi:hypothetical protein
MHTVCAGKSIISLPVRTAYQKENSEKKYEAERNLFLMYFRIIILKITSSADGI